ncbi:MAG TPA: RNA methyltransferase [Blastocatellia bacterium]|nr:RNA methyltransferase [Blastocatellia bacterium]
MLIEKITSRHNPLVKRFRNVRAGAEHQFVFIEGVRLVEEALKAGVHFESIAFSSAAESTDRGLELLDALQRVPCRGAHVSPQVMEGIADTENTQGIAAIVSRPYYELDEALANAPQLVVIADQLQDPGNLGSIIRTAEAAGATGVITTRQTVDPFNQKALRASMGSALRLPVVTDAKAGQVFAACRKAGIKIVASDPAADHPRPAIEDAAQVAKVCCYTDFDFTGPVALVMGREASGVSSEVEGSVDAYVRIPMAASVESLNVAAAAAIILYEAARQREFRLVSNSSKTGN